MPSFYRIEVYRFLSNRSLSTKVNKRCVSRVFLPFNGVDLEIMDCELTYYFACLNLPIGSGVIESDGEGLMELNYSCTASVLKVSNFSRQNGYFSIPLATAGTLQTLKNIDTLAGRSRS